MYELYLHDNSLEMRFLCHFVNPINSLSRHHNAKEKERLFYVLLN